jgi:hypothetical protein
MVLGRFFNRVSPETYGDQLIAKAEELYDLAKRQNPTGDPHELLALTWIGMMAGFGGVKGVSGEAQTILAFSETMQFSCIPFPGNARAFALHFLYKNNPEIISKVAKFSSEYEKLMGPIHRRIQHGTLREECRKYNPSSNLEHLLGPM